MTSTKHSLKSYLIVYCLVEIWCVCAFFRTKCKKEKNDFFYLLIELSYEKGRTAVRQLYLVIKRAERFVTDHTLEWLANVLWIFIKIFIRSESSAGNKRNNEMILIHQMNV